MQATRLRFTAAVLALTSLGVQPVTPAPRAGDRPGLERSIRVAFVGDIMLDWGPGRLVADGVDPFQHVAHLLGDADVTVGNLECVVATGGQRVDKPYNFRAHPRAVTFLKRHLDAVSLANNHTGDFGPEALLEMIGRLRDGGVGFFGAGRNAREAHAPWVVEKNGLKVAFLGYNEFPPRSFEATETRPGCAWSETAAVVADIQAVRPRVDFVLTFMHWGREYEFEPTDRQKALARAMIDAGADAVIGGHPHVVQTVEQYKGRPIVYSLGNFVFDDYKTIKDPDFREPSRTGWWVRLKLTKSGPVDWDTAVTRTDDDGLPHPWPGARKGDGANHRSGSH